MIIKNKYWVPRKELIRATLPILMAKLRRMKAAAPAKRTPRKKARFLGWLAFFFLFLISFRQVGTVNINKAPRKLPMREKTKPPINGWVV